MLIDFTVSNYRSIKEPQTLSMLATTAKENPDNVFKIDDKVSLLKTAAVYGANGSGKSNVINAFQTMKYFIRNSTDIKRGDNIKHYQPFRLDKSTLNQPTSFGIEFIGDDQIRYKYEFSFNESQIISEGLFFYPKNQEALLFTRISGKPIHFGDSLKGAKKSIESQLLPNHLFLSKAANSNHHQLGVVYGSLNNFVLIDNDLSNSFINYTSNQIGEEDKHLLETVTSFLRQADTGVEGLILKPNEGYQIVKFPGTDLEDWFETQKYRVQTLHKVYDGDREVESIPFDLYDESEGTQKLYGLGGQIAYLLECGAVVMIDELNNSFHPLITEMIVKLFNNPQTNPKNAQLIFATHDTSILKPELFRRDQIWFTEKDRYGATALYSLSEFDYDKVRPNVPFDKWYLSGRFGALPLVKEFNFSTDAQAKEGE